MQKSNTSLSEIKLVGIKVRTSNQAESNPETSKIASMAGKYFHNSISESIPNKNNPGITYIAYTEYDSNYQGDYTCFIGEKVSQFDNIPENLETHIIPAQNYIKFTTESGPMPNIVIGSWMEIWQMQELEAQRSYKTDFEIYDSRAADPSNTILDIYIGII
jgi:predicted transcriptional regulator YdeE